MKREHIIEKWAEILYVCAVRLGSARVDESLYLITHWDDYKNKRVFRDVAEELWAAIEGK